MIDYATRAEDFAQQSNTHSKQALTFSLLRGASFIAFIAFLILFFNSDQVLWLISGIVSIGLFSALVGKHRFHEDQKLYYQTLVDINDIEDLRGIEIAEKVVKSELSNKDKQLKLVEDMLGDATLN